MDADENVIGPNNGRITSWLASLANAHRSGGQRFRVLVCLASDEEHGGEGLTDEQMQDRLSMSANSQRPRRVELEQWGFIEQKDDEGRTRAGNKAHRYVMTEQGRATIRDRRAVERWQMAVVS